MKRPFNLVWLGIKATYEEMLLLVVLSLLFWVCWLLVIPGPPATAGLYLVAHRIANERSVNFGLFKEGFRRYFGRSWIITGVSLALLVVLVSSFFFYLGLPPQFPQWMQALSVVMLYLLIAWFAVQLYLFPVLLEQDMRIGLVFRNAFYLTFASPIFTGVLLLILVVIVLLCAVTTLLLFLIAPGLVAVISSLALQDRLAFFRAKTHGVT